MGWSVYNNAGSLKTDSGTGGFPVNSLEDFVIIKVPLRNYSGWFVRGDAGSTGTEVTVGGGLSSATILGTGTFVSDTAAHWRRSTSAATSASTFGVTFPTLQLWADHDPLIMTRIRMGSDITNQRDWLCFAADTTTLDLTVDNPHTVHGFGFRYSTNASDTKFTPFTIDGSTFTTGVPIMTVSASTDYILQARVSSATLLPGGSVGLGVAFTVYNNATLQSAQTTMALPSAVKGNYLQFSPARCATLANVAKVIDCQSAFFDTGGLFG